MIGIDTNLLVRYITQDGKEAAGATRHLERVCKADSPGFICTVVLCELVWVLRGAYGYERSAIAAILEKLLTTEEFEIERSALVWRALKEYRNGPADFSDYVIAHTCSEVDAVPVHTLDKKAGKTPLFFLVTANSDQ